LKIKKISEQFCLCPQEGILQKLQRSVEQEESKWKIKADESQRMIKQVFKGGFTAAELSVPPLSPGNTV
jgi:kinectin